MNDRKLVHDLLHIFLQGITTSGITHLILKSYDLKSCRGYPWLQIKLPEHFIKS